MPLEKLRATAAAIPHPVYWLGTQPDDAYEFTQTKDGRVDIRYLPPGAKVGSARGDAGAEAEDTVTPPPPLQHSIQRSGAHGRGRPIGVLLLPFGTGHLRPVRSDARSGRHSVVRAGAELAPASFRDCDRPHSAGQRARSSSRAGVCRMSSETSARRASMMTQRRSTV